MRLCWHRLLIYTKLTTGLESGTNSPIYFFPVQEGLLNLLQMLVVLYLDNPCVVDGQAVADWILAQCKYRLAYSVDERGNPARELEDTIQIYDAYGNSNAARVISEEFTLNTGLSGRTKAVTLLNEL